MSNENQQKTMEKSNDETNSTSDDDIVDDDDDDTIKKYLSLSSEEINLRISTFQNLCTGNKLNTTNAFDIDMIEYFASWLEKKKSLQSDGYGSFQEVSDYLDVSGKIYSLRVDNVTETTGKLAEKFRSLYLKAAALDTENKNEQFKLPKPKRPKVMLTTAEKLKLKITETDNFVDPSTKQGNYDFEWKELFEISHPSNYLSSVYLNNSLTEEKQKAVQSKNDMNNFFSISNLNHELTKKVICSEFCDFDDEESNNVVDVQTEFKIEGIENHFDPEFNNFNNNLNNGQLEKCDANSDDNNCASIDTLLECVDNVNRDYSFFNPLILANWKSQGKGRKAWKTRAMVKSLKSCNPNEREQMLSIPYCFDGIEELTQQKPIPKTTSKRTKKEENETQITWKSIKEIEKILLPKVKKKEKLMPKTMQKWFPLINGGTSCVTVDTKIKFDLLKYHEIEPDWWIPEENMSNNSSKPSPNYQNFDGCYDETCDFIDAEKKEALEEDTKLNEFIQDLSTFNESKRLPSGDDDILKEFKTEVKMDIGDLKKEISKIIDQECIEIDPEHGMYGKLLFSNLLKKLNIQEQGGPSVSVVFVGLLHLTNELGLKLHQKPSTINDIKELCIFKPLNKM